jgi:putative salt-induced outer membrane protein YdiY
MKALTCSIFTLLFISLHAAADRVRTVDGAELTGTITLIDKGVIHLDTSYAGTLKIKQDQVASFESDEPRVVRLASGTVMAGPISSDGQGKIRIQSEDGVLETNTAKVSTAWSPGSEDPEIVRNRRAWRYQASVDLTGRSGNTDRFALGTHLQAELKGPDDTLAFFFTYEQAEEDETKTEDRVAGGASYESFFSPILGWYVRTELEADRIDRIGLRSTNAGGLSYRLINKENQSLVARSGLGYRYTSFTDNVEDESSATLDFGLAHSFRYKDIFRMKNDLTYVPAIDDFGNYRVVHDSGIEVPVGSSENWKLRFGIRNEYLSDTTAEEKLDTSYYTRMIYSWD